MALSCHLFLTHNDSRSPTRMDSHRADNANQNTKLLFFRYHPIPDTPFLRTGCTYASPEATPKTRNETAGTSVDEAPAVDISMILSSILYLFQHIGVDFHRISCLQLLDPFLLKEILVIARHESANIINLLGHTDETGVE